MQVQEIICEQPQHQLHSKIMMLLLPMKSRGVRTVTTDSVLGQLQDSGIVIDREALVAHLQDRKPDFVKNVTDSVITLGTPEQSAAEQDQQQQHRRELSVSRQAIRNIRDRQK